MDMSDRNPPNKSFQQGELPAVKNPLVKEFISRLQEMEKTHLVKPLIELFADPAELANLTRHNTHSKTPELQSSALRFWSHYLNAFDYVSSHFLRITEGEKNAILEWHSTARLPTGVPVDYQGVSLLEFEDDRITSFRTYYDSAALLPHHSHAEKRYSESVGIPEITDQATS
jgi:ketosteroid isomerase-like protein